MQEHNHTLQRKFTAIYFGYAKPHRPVNFRWAETLWVSGETSGTWIGRFGISLKSPLNIRKRPKADVL